MINQRASDGFVDALSYSLGTKMGCDIHWYSETLSDSGQWVCDQADSMYNAEDEDEPPYYEMNSFRGSGRDYWFFGLLNNVRIQWPFSFTLDQTGNYSIPDDPSEEVSTLYHQWSSDAHSAGYLTGQQIKDKLEELKLLPAQYLIDPEPGISIEHVEHCMKRLQETLENLGTEVPLDKHRIIFWFDN